MEPEFSNREIETKFNTLEKDITVTHLNIQDKLDKILSQTTKTNGRVSRLELWRAGIVAVIASLSPVAFFITYEVLKKLTN